MDCLFIVSLVVLLLCVHLPNNIGIWYVLYLVFSHSGCPGAERVPGTIAKTYAPFMIFVYWAAVYPTHNPWHDPTKTYLVLMAHILLPVFIMIETFRPKNTHYSEHPQINGDFLGSKSFAINTAVYVIFFIVYLITVPHIKDPIYTHLGFTKNASEDAILAFVGWCIVMFIDSVISGITYWIKNKETERQREQFSHFSSDPTPYRIFISGNAGL